MVIVPYPGPYWHQRVELQPIVSGFENRSELTGARQAVDTGYSWWRGTVEVTRVAIEDARAWRLFFGRVRGTVHSFRLPVMSQPQHAGNFVVRAQGAGAGYSLVTDGWPASANTLFAGDYVTVGDQLMELDADPVADATGKATLEFHSSLRGTVADNTVITTAIPHLLASLPDGAPALNTEEIQDGFSFDVREAY